ncbi:tyrosine--tRNA ligase [Calidifontibacter indicus]|uniref:Tyrosine--tRNA ligase n=1 Tax=Calidifontibacter indicus TaxID=419650 RepID=A0A3D9UWE7_9MICO|nr:tyrosine--tRNA ligase [Calidifontibacter indicus]REF30925.1 tyrosyl-tRNA synthetase [Calidifontibacter indicus]
MSNIFDELQWRGLVAQTTDEAALREALDGTLTMYVGFDPTAPSLHFGNLVQLVVARKLQRAGHHVICLVGGSTGLIGDPKPDSERVLRSKEQVAEAVASIQRQAESFLDFEGDNPARMVNNLDWTEGISALDFLRDYGKYFRVNSMIKKDAVSARLNSDAGISYTEFSYQILQGLDYLHLFRTYDCTLQTGAVDQWGNILAGVDLIRQAEGKHVHVLTTPLLTDSTGRKYGKSEGNAIWLDPTMTSPYAFFQYFLNVEDSEVIKLLKVFSDLGPDEIKDYEEQVANEPFKRAAQRALAAAATTLVHGAVATVSAQAASEALFGKGDLHALDAGTLQDATAELPGGVVPAGTPIVDALITVGIADSRNAARRLIGDGGVSVNNEKVTDVDATLGADDYLHGVVAVIKRGRKYQAAARAS